MARGRVFACAIAVAAIARLTRLEAGAAVTVSLSGGGTVLKVQGTAGGDDVDVVIDDDANALVVRDFGVAIASYPSAQIEKVRVKAGGGDDVVDLLLAPDTDLLFDKELTIDLGSGADQSLVELRDGLDGTVLLRGTLRVKLAGGPGDDVVFAHFGRKQASALSFAAAMGSGDDECRASLWGDVIGGGDVELECAGGPGNDILGTFSVYDTVAQAYDEIAVTADSTAAIRLAGQGGDDVFQARLSATMDGRVRLVVDGGPGADTVDEATTFVRPGSGGTHEAHVFGRGGDDTLALDVNDLSAGGLDALDATLSGQAGVDACNSMPPVIESGCES